jgi:hypothetical protein
MASKHLLTGEDVALRHPAALSMLVHDVQMAVSIEASQENDGVMGVAIVHGGGPLAAEGIVELGNDMSIRAKGFKELTGSNIPTAVVPGLPLPTGTAGENAFIFGIDEAVVADGGVNEASLGLAVELEGMDEEGVIPMMTNAARVGGGVDTGTPAGLGSAIASSEVLPFTEGKSGSLFNANDIVFEAEEGVVNLLFVLVMFGVNARAIFENQNARTGVEGVRQMAEHTLTEVVKALDIGLAGLAEEQALKAGVTLAIIATHLSQEPMRFSAPASAAIPDGGGTVGQIAEAGGGTGSELARLEEDARANKVLNLIDRTAGSTGVASELSRIEIGVHRLFIRQGFATLAPRGFNLASA